MALRYTPESRPLADALAQRSVGIKDLRYGALVDEDWAERDPEAWGPTRAPTSRCWRPPPTT